MSGRPDTQLRFPAVLMRGGTSKGLFFLDGVLPTDPAERDRVLLRAIGGGDPFGSEIDGVGGATSSTSKAVIVAPSTRPGFDLDYHFAQVEIDRPEIDWQGSCGNLAAAVGPFAIDEALVSSRGDETRLRIWQVNTKKEIVAHVRTRGGWTEVDGVFAIDGVPHTGAAIRLDFMDPGGSLTGSLFPTGHVVDELVFAGGSARATLIDAGNPSVFVRASDLGLRGTELPREINADSSLLQRLEAIRGAAAVAMGLALSAEGVASATPKIGYVCEPASYATASGRTVAATDVDIVARVISMGRLHHAVPATAAVATAMAASAAGSIPWEMARGKQGDVLRLGHSSGVMPVDAAVRVTNGTVVAERATLWRTSRRLMEGAVFVPFAS